MTESIAFKVVLALTEADRTHRYSYAYSMLPDGWVVEYPVGEVAYPKIGLLTCFASFDNAEILGPSRSFWTGDSRMEIWKCDAQVVGGPLNICPVRIPKYGFDLSLRYFWSRWNEMDVEEKCDRHSRWHLIISEQLLAGMLWASSLRLVERVK